MDRPSRHINQLLLSHTSWVLAPMLFRNHPVELSAARGHCEGKALEIHKRAGRSYDNLPFEFAVVGSMGEPEPGEYRVAIQVGYKATIVQQRGDRQHAGPSEDLGETSENSLVHRCRLD